MYITADDIKNEISFYYQIDNRFGDKKIGLIRTYFVYSFYNVEQDEKIHLKNGEMLKVKRGCYTMKDIEKVFSGKVKYDNLTGKSVIDASISRFGPYINKILGISFKGVLLIFTQERSTTKFARDTEEFYNPKITKRIEVAVEGVPNELYAQNMEYRHQYDEIVNTLQKAS